MNMDQTTVLQQTCHADNLNQRLAGLFVTLLLLFAASGLAYGAPPCTEERANLSARAHCVTSTAATVCAQLAIARTANAEPVLSIKVDDHPAVTRPGLQLTAPDTNPVATVAGLDHAPVDSVPLYLRHRRLLIPRFLKIA